MELRLPATGILDVGHALAVLELHSLPAQERLDAAAAQLHRVLQLDGNLVEVSLSLDPAGVSLTHDAPTESIARLTEIINHWLGLQQDTTAAYEALQALPCYQPLAMAYPSLRLISYPDTFEALATTIIGQQVSLAAARTLGGRYVGALGQQHGSGLRAFPTAASTAACTPGELRAIIRCPLPRATALHAVAEWFEHSGKFLLGDVPAFLEQLQGLRGVGPWTRNYLALRGLRDPEIFLESDLVVRRAMSKLHDRGVTVAPPPKGAGYLATLLLWSFDAAKL
ncbi:hypothetical protein [Glutamicibacter sp.]|uniref:DNA-3-methyladenine glycosylase family protein n=1 Tax=Glutamicibacter sp. TaxID=1931995 RepID=UPI002FC7E9AC